jgi:hypothetical protein
MKKRIIEYNGMSIGVSYGDRNPLCSLKTEEKEKIKKNTLSF